MCMGSTGAFERSRESLDQSVNVSFLTISIQGPPHQHQAPSDPASLIRKWAVSRFVQRLRETAIRCLEWPSARFICRSKPKKRLHAKVTAVVYEILQHGFDQFRMCFEVIILTTTTKTHTRVRVRSRSEPEEVVRPILNGDGRRSGFLVCGYLWHLSVP